MLLARIISKLFFHSKVIQILPKHQHEEIQEPNWFLSSKSRLEQLKTHKNTWHNHSAITFTYFVKTKKFQKEKCRESCHEQLSFTTYKQKTNGSRVRGARNSRFHKEKRKSLRAFSSSSSIKCGFNEKKQHRLPYGPPAAAPSSTHGWVGLNH